MPIFDDLAPLPDLWPSSRPWPLRRAQAAIRRFQCEFSGVHFELCWDIALLNAQAFLGNQGRCVRLFGGLARHRCVGIEGLAFALAHETGHHLGGPPLHPGYHSISSEERANQWAVEVGLPKVFGDVKSRRYAQVGAAQLKSVWSRYAKTGDIDPFPILRASEP